MTAQRWDGSSWQDITTAKRWDGSSWVDLTVAKRWDGSAWHDIIFAGGGTPGSLSAVTSSADATNIFIATDPPFDPIVTLNTPSVVVNVTGGVPPYTYQWTRVSGDGKAACVAPTSFSTYWTANLYKNNTSSSYWKCTVTDSIGNTVDVFVSVELAYYAGAIP